MLTELWADQIRWLKVLEWHPRAGRCSVSHPTAADGTGPVCVANLGGGNV